MDDWIGIIWSIRWIGIKGFKLGRLRIIVGLIFRLGIYYEYGYYGFLCCVEDMIIFDVF